MDIHQIPIKAMKLSKFLKRLVKPEGEMMTIYHSIYAAHHCSDTPRIKEILAELKANPQEFWRPHYNKTVQLILLCEYLIVQNPAARKAALFRLRLALDPFHELGRRIEAFLEEISNASRLPLSREPK